MTTQSKTAAPIRKELLVATCPHCDGDMLYTGSGETSGDQISENYTCTNCDDDFVVWYKIIAIYEDGGRERQWEPNV